MIWISFDQISLSDLNLLNPISFIIGSQFGWWYPPQMLAFFLMLFLLFFVDSGMWPYGHDPSRCAIGYSLVIVSSGKCWYLVEVVGLEQVRCKLCYKICEALSYVLAKGVAAAPVLTSMSGVYSVCCGLKTWSY